MSDKTWLDGLRRIVEESAVYDWETHLKALNTHLGLGEEERFSITIPGVSPMWFNGDVEAIQSGQWALVVSLNHQIASYSELPGRAGAWDFFREHNRRFWYPRFFRPLTQVASAALAETLATEDEPEFATTRMVFVELCPYASRRFNLAPEVVVGLTSSDPGFRTAARINSLLIEEGRPALILVNGSPALAHFKAAYGDHLTQWQVVEYPSDYQGSPRKQLWHEQGLLRLGSAETHVIAFPFLRTSRTHNANIEIRQLGEMGRRLLAR